MNSWDAAKPGELLAASAGDPARIPDAAAKRCGGLCVLVAGHAGPCFAPSYIRDAKDAEAEFEINQMPDDVLGMEDGPVDGEAVSVNRSVALSFVPPRGHMPLETANDMASQAGTPPEVPDDAEYRVGAAEICRVHGLPVGNDLTDLATMIRRLAHTLRACTGGHQLCETAMDLLRRKGLEGSPLRASERSEAHAKESSSDNSVSGATREDVKPYTREELKALPGAPGNRNCSCQIALTYEEFDRLLATARSSVEDRERLEAFAAARIGLTVPEIQDLLQLATAGRKVDVSVAFAVHQLIARILVENGIVVSADAPPPTAPTVRCAFCGSGNHMLAECHLGGAESFRRSRSGRRDGSA